jgi:hypothetical protein
MEHKNAQTFQNRRFAKRSQFRRKHMKRIRLTVTRFSELLASNEPNAAPNHISQGIAVIRGTRHTSSQQAGPCSRYHFNRAAAVFLVRVPLEMPAYEA